MKNDTTKSISDINIEEHFGLVHLCCQRFRKRGVEYDDIFQCGCIGLIKAAKNFDVNKEVKFSTYAVPVILGEIKAFFRDNSPLKVSRSIKDLSNKIKIEEEKFLSTYSREPTINELSKILNTDIEHILEALEVCRPVISLDNTDTNDESNHGEKDIPVQFDEENISLRVSLNKILDTFECQDRNLIYLRFFKGITQSKIAEKLGMTQVQVSRREKVLLKLLREKLV